MNPTEAFTKFLKLDPMTGRFVFGGLALLSAATIVLGFGSNINDAANAAIYVLGFATAVTILSFITRNSAMRKVICWVTVGLFGVWVAGLVDSAFQISGRTPPTPCYIMLPLELPEACVARLTRDVITIGSVGALPAVAPSNRALLWQAQTDPIAAPEPADPALAAGTMIILQFTAPVTRDQAMALATGLTGLGWLVDGAETGGEEVAEGPMRNEVRFFHTDDQDRAIGVAQSLHGLSPAAPVEVRDFSRLGSYVPRGQVEIWVNNLDLALPPEA